MKGYKNKLMHKCQKERMKRKKLEWKDTRTNECINERKKGRKDECLNKRKKGRKDECMNDVSQYIK